VRTKSMADELGEALIGRGLQAEVIHGDLSQAQRERAIAGFRDGRTELLVATDVASRGLDIPNVSHIINYDIPEDPDAYVHRIGRTARAGKTGTAITLVTPRERGLLRTIEHLTRVRLTRIPIPSASDIAERRAQLLRESLRESIEEDQLGPYLMMVEEMAGDYDLAQVAAAAIKLAFEERMGALPQDGEEPPPEPGTERLFVRAGRRQGITARDLVGAIANEANISGRDIGPIDIYDNFSFVGVPRADAQRVIDAVSRSGVRGRPVTVTIAVPERELREVRGRR
jgi:ATP-dependent RNA helicase DeaD